MKYYAPAFAANRCKRWPLYLQGTTHKKGQDREGWYTGKRLAAIMKRGKPMTGELFTNYAYAKKVLTREEYAFIYLSPHLDDVAFSCSGSICAQQAQGLHALVVTLCAGNPEPPFSPLAQACHQLWQVPEGVPPYQARQREDEQAMAVLAVDFAWLN